MQKAESSSPGASDRCRQALGYLLSAIGYSHTRAVSGGKSPIANRQWPTWLCAFVLFALLAGVALAEQRFPPPDFESGHKLPITTTPPARAIYFQYLDVAVLAADGSVQVMLAHLKSYEKMGMASISCLSGCTCTPTKVNGTASIKASLTSFAAITMSNPSAKCILVVENLFDSAVASAAGFVKFKVIGLAMNEKSASKQQYLFSSDHDSYDDNRSG